MAFKPKSTNDGSVRGAEKTLLYGSHGFGKTTQAKYMQERYGKTFIVSGESGLRSVMDDDIDYLPFTSWDGDHSPDDDVYSLQGIRLMMTEPDFLAHGYKCLFLDSLTEACDMLKYELDQKYAGTDDGFAVWNDYAAEALGTVKWIRDLPYHVVVTALAKEDVDANKVSNWWPNVQGRGVSKQLPGIFDNVFCGVRKERELQDGSLQVARFLITDQVRGWHGKARDPKRRLAPVMRTGDITDLFARMELDDEAYETYVAAKKAAEELLGNKLTEN